MQQGEELQPGDDRGIPGNNPCCSDELPEPPPTRTYAHVVRILRELVVAIVAAVVIAAASGSHFAAVVVIAGSLFVVLQLFELARWRAAGRLHAPRISPGVWCWSSMRLAASIALCMCGLVIASTEVLAPLAAILLVTILVGHRRALSALPRAAPDYGRPSWLQRAGWQLRYMRDDERGCAQIEMTMPEPAARVLTVTSDAISRHGLPALVALLVGVGLILCAIAFGSGALTGRWGPRSPSPRHERRAAAGPPHAATPKAATTPAPGSTARTSAAWNGVCPPAGEQILPPRWQADAEALRSYYEHESRLGPPEEGCLGPLSTHVGPATGTAYATANGSNPTTLRPLSFAVTSRAFGLAVFREPAAAWVERLVAQLEGPVGGVGRFPDYPVRAGDYYLVRTSRGIYVLLRENEEAEYVELPPTVGQAWLAMMKERHAWLWPEPPHAARDGEREYPVYSDETPEAPEGSISLDPQSGEAVRAGVQYLPDEVREIGLGELQALAKTA